MAENNNYKELLDIIHFTEQVSTKLHGLSENEIFSTIRKEFLRSKKYYITILMLTEDHLALNIVATTFAREKKKLNLWEKVANTKLKDFKINLKKSSIYSRAILKKEIFHVTGEEICKDLFPGKVIKLPAGTADYKYSTTIITPLLLNNESIGAIALGSPDFSDYFIPTVVHFSHHISNALSLSRSEQKYRDLVENIDDMIITTGGEGKITYSSSQIEKLGYSPEKIIGRNIIELSIDEDREKVTENLNYAINEKKLRTIHARARNKNGKIIWFENKGKLIFDNTGKLAKTINVFRDITEKKQYEKKYQELIENIHDVIFFMDTMGNIRYLSPQASILGYPSEYYIGKSAFDFVYPEDLEYVVKNFERGLKTGEKFPTVFRMQAKDGSIFWFEEMGKVQYDDSGNPSGITGILRNITERKNAEEKAKENEEMLMQHIKQAPFPIVILTSDGIIKLLNKNFTNLFDNFEKQKLLENYNLFNDPFMRSLNIIDRIKKVFEGSPVSIEELKLPLKSDLEKRYKNEKFEEVILRIEVFPILKDTKIWRIVLIFVDITEIRNHQIRYKQLFEKMLSGAAIHEIICDKKGEPVNYRFLKINPAFEKMTKLKADEIIGKTAIDIIPDLESSWVKLYGKVALTGEPVSVEKFVSGINRYFQVSAYQNTPGQFVAIFQDITENKKQKEDLEKKNVALKEILSQIELEKKNIKDEITQNIDKIIIPSMNLLEQDVNIPGKLKKYIDKMKLDLRNITSSLIPKNVDVFTKLSPKEMEICNMARNGMKNKQIAGILNITLQTVETHKRNIRKKLGISGQKINLRTYLERL